MSHEQGYVPSAEEINLAEQSMSEIQSTMSEVRFRALTDPELIGKKIVFIMRGVPGSGKSTIANELAENFDGVVHSTDHYFTNQDGVYEFDRAQLSAAHQANFEAFRASLEENRPMIIVDNTNVKRWEFEKYATLAEQMGYAVQEVVAPTPELSDALARNIHGVPEETIRRMLLNFEE